MAQLTPSQVRWRGRIESGLRIVAPVLDLLLAVGDRVSRVVDREDADRLTVGRVGPDAQPRLTDGRD